MKRTIVAVATFFALFFWGFFVDSSGAVEVKLRSPAARQEPQDDSQALLPKSSLSSEEDSAMKAQNSNSNGTLESKTSKNGRDVRKTPSSQKSKENVASSEEKQDVKTPGKKSSKDNGVRKNASFAPLTPEEWEKRYSKVQGATLLTVESLIPTKKLSNIRVLRVFTRIPRVEFIPKKQRDLAYVDVEVSLDGEGQEPRPFDVAFSIEALNPQESDRVLVVEAGGGYSAAILSGLAAEVYAVGANRDAVKHASDACKKLRYANVDFQTGDPLEGRSDSAPFNKILVTRAVESIPSSLVDQLAEGGLIVAPVGDRFRQLWVLGKKKNGTLEESVLLPTRVGPLTEDFSDRDLTAPTLVGGGFEELDPEPSRDNFDETGQEDATEKKENNAFSATPIGWYDAWNFNVADSGDSYEGSKACRFVNETIALNHEKKDRNEERIRAATLPEERVEITEASEAVKRNQRERELRSQMSQSFAVDGSAVRKLVVSGAYRVASLRSRVEKTTAELVRIEFFDRGRKSLGATSVVESALEPCAWEEFSTDVSVPARAREATLTIGLLDGIGAVEFDGLEVRDKFEKSSRNR